MATLELEIQRVEPARFSGRKYHMVMYSCGAYRTSTDVESEVHPTDTWLVSVCGMCKAAGIDVHDWDAPLRDALSGEDDMEDVEDDDDDE
jgi:C1A family cysteine protease